jgi:hypothetical protein
MMPTDASAQEEAVVEMLQRTGPCCLDDLVRYLPNLSWDEVFVAIDRMSRDGRLSLRQLGYSTYQITLRSLIASPGTKEPRPRLLSA